MPHFDAEKLLPFSVPSRPRVEDVEMMRPSSRRPMTGVKSLIELEVPVR